MDSICPDDLKRVSSGQSPKATINFHTGEIE